VHGDDAVYVEAASGSGEQAWPIPRPAHVATATMAAHPGLVAVGHVDEGGRKSIVPLVGAQHTGPLPVRALLFPSIAAESGITQIEPADVFSMLLGSSGLAMLERAPRRDALLDVLASLGEVRAARWSLGRDALSDPARAGAAALEWLA
jgi:hypothetical protein